MIFNKVVIYINDEMCVCVFLMKDDKYEKERNDILQCDDLEKTNFACRNIRSCLERRVYENFERQRT